MKAMARLYWEVLCTGAHDHALCDTLLLVCWWGGLPKEFGELEDFGQKGAGSDDERLGKD